MQFTGKIGDSITISGNNFYRISRVLFGTAASNFEVIDSSNIRARVPSDASWDYINIVSDDRGISGLSSQKFAPMPHIDSYSPISGLSGDSVNLTGSAFSGVTGVTFNGLQSSFTVNNNKSITAIVPSGAIRGNVVVLGQSGLSQTANTPFSPEIKITGANPISGFAGSTGISSGWSTGQGWQGSTIRLGSSMVISGKYFFEELMFTGNQTGKYLVSVGGNLKTGYFERLDNNRLSGRVPEGGIHGKINVARDDSTLENVKYYDSNYASVNFTAIAEEPKIEVTSSVGAYSETLGNTAISIKGKGIGTDFDGKNLTLGLIEEADVDTFLAGLGGGLLSIALSRSNEYNGELESKNSAHIFHSNGEAYAAMNEGQFGDDIDLNSDTYEGVSSDKGLAFAEGKSIRGGSHYGRSEQERDQNQKISIKLHVPKNLRDGTYRVAVERRATEDYSNPRADSSVQPDHYFREVSDQSISIAGKITSYNKDSDKNLGTPLHAKSSEIDIANNAVSYYDVNGSKITDGVHKLTCRKYQDFIGEGGWTEV